MAFLKTLWKENSAPKIRAAELNRIEQGIADAHAGLATPPLVAALPANPVNGQVVDLQTAAMQAIGLVWRLRYRDKNADGANNASPYKWECIGGQPLYNQAPDAGATTNAGAPGVLLPNASPVVTCPLAGEYLFEFTGDLFAQTANLAIIANLFINGASTKRVGIMRNESAQWGGGMGGGRFWGTVPGAGQVADVRFWVSPNGGANGSIDGAATLTAMPVRVG